MGRIGKSKLCINRASFPDDDRNWYVVAMKCIPEWENCDKCLCGRMRDQDKKKGYCRFNGQGNNDDMVDISCNKPKKIKMYGTTYKFENNGRAAYTKLKEDEDEDHDERYEDDYDDLN